MKTECDVMIDQVRAVDNKRLIRRIGTIEPDTRELIRTSLTIVFDL